MTSPPRFKFGEFAMAIVGVIMAQLMLTMTVYDDDRREALGIWKSRLGNGATYRALIEVFFKAGRLDYADAVCSLLKDSSDTRDKTVRSWS